MEPHHGPRSTTSGLSPVRLARMHDTLLRYVDRGRLPGLVALISRRGAEHVDAIGTLAFEGTAPMRRDTIFRLASVTKPITASAMLRTLSCTKKGLPCVRSTNSRLSGTNSARAQQLSQQLLRARGRQRVDP
jgi:hypothetical protein